VSVKAARRMLMKLTQMSETSYIFYQMGTFSNLHTFFAITYALSDTFKKRYFQGVLMDKGGKYP